MTFSEAIKGGFSLVYNRWQLIAVQVGMMLFNCAGFFIVVGIPLGIAFIIFGLDLTGLAETRDVLGIFKNPGELFSKYFGLILIVITSLLFYILAATTLGLYVFGGSAGVIGRTLLEPSSKFSMRMFFTEAKKMFFPLLWFSLLIGLIFIAIAFVLGLFGGGIAAVVSAAKSQDSTLALFLGIFFSLILILVALGIIFTALAVAMYGVAVLFFKHEGAIKSFKEAVKFLWNNQYAFWLYILLFLGYILASFMLMLIVYPFKLIPIAGAILSFPIQILSYVVQSYIGLVMIAVLFIYYYEAEVRKEETPPEAQGETIGENSTSPEDISGLQTPSQVEPLPEKDGPEQA
ncbi:MAG: hypothetical protein AB1632_05055 [Nitrospirota bacterium]